MQKRLFTIFLLLSLIPAMVILLANWQISERHLGFLDSPGLMQSFESSLQLARDRLDRELVETAAQLERIIESGAEIPPDGAALVLLSEAQVERTVGIEDDQLLEVLLRTELADLSRQRISTESDDWLVAVRDIRDIRDNRDIREEPATRLVLARPLAPEIAATLEAVAQGSSRLRQMRLYYGDLLRGDTLATLVLLGVILLVVSLLLSRHLARRIAGPVRALAEGTRRVAEGDLEHEVVADAPDEMGQLVQAFNRMTDDLRIGKEDLVRAERVAAWRGVARRLAHEIKNPLTPITLAMHRIGKRSDDEAVRDAVATVLEETENLKRLADEFSHYARLPEPKPEPADLGDLARSVLELYVDDARTRVHREDLSDPAPVRVDAGQMRQALGNLVKNAVAAAGPEGTLTVRLSRKAEEITFEVSDSGPGLPEEAEVVFEPYFTTRETGTGLGLPVARKIVEDHGGRLDAANSADMAGAVFTLTLPRYRSPDREEER